MEKTILIQLKNKNLKIYVLCILLFTLIFFADLLIPLGVAAGVLYIAVVLVSLWIPEKKFTLKIAIISSLLTITGFYFSPEGGELWKVIFNRAISLFAIWTTTILTLQRKAIDAKRFADLQEKKRLIEETKILKGLLPICASCKKIRDDKGYWIQIESYIQKYSDAKFSHGICQECQEKLYGDQEWYKKRKTRS